MLDYHEIEPYLLYPVLTMQFGISKQENPTPRLPITDGREKQRTDFAVYRHLTSSHIIIQMISRRRIIIRTRRILNTEIERRIRCCVIQKQLCAPRTIRKSIPVPCLVSICRSRVPEDFASSDAGWNPVVGVVGDRVELLHAGEGEDLTSGGEEIVVGHVGRGVGKSPAGVGVGVRGDGQVIWRRGGGVRCNGNSGCGRDCCSGSGSTGWVGGYAGGNRLCCYGCLVDCGHRGGRGYGRGSCSAGGSGGRFDRCRCLRYWRCFFAARRAQNTCRESGQCRWRAKSG